jgi:uncharacterized protein YdeI (BOF family)
MDLLMSDKSHVGVEINAPDGIIGSAILPLQAHVPPELWRETIEVDALARDTLGFSRNQQGDFTGNMTPKSAAEVMTVREASEIRADERRDIVADVLTRIIRKWNQYIFKYWTKERVIQIAGNDGQMYWVKFTGADLAGEYSLRIDPDAGLPVTRGMRHQSAKELFMLLKDDPLTDQIKLRHMLLQQYEYISPAWQGLIKAPPMGQQPIGLDQFVTQQGQIPSGGGPRAVV